MSTTTLHGSFWKAPKESQQRFVRDYLKDGQTSSRSQAYTWEKKLCPTCRSEVSKHQTVGLPGVQSEQTGETSSSEGMALPFKDL